MRGRRGLLIGRVLPGLLPALLAACGGGSGDTSNRETPPRAESPPVHMTMHDLHLAGGVPPGWSLTPPPGSVEAGRRLFVDLGCHSCHLVKGENFPAGSDEEHVGPELTGMGSHHPAAYFVEAILNPDAVLIDGPGYVTDDDRSRMPIYPDMTLAQLADLVAYLQSLTEGGMPGMKPAPGSLMSPRPKPPAGGPAILFVQSYDVKPGQLAAFEEWFRREGAPQLLACDGLETIETYVDNTRSGPPLVTMMGFRDDQALSRFLYEPDATLLKRKWDEFLGPHGHQIFRTPPVYRVDSLSAP